MNKIMEKGDKERKKRGRGRRESNKPSKATRGIQMFYRVTRVGAEIDRPDADSKTLCAYTPSGS